MFTTTFQFKFFCSGQRKCLCKPLVVSLGADGLEGPFKADTQSCAFPGSQARNSAARPRALGFQGPLPLGGLGRPLGWKQPAPRSLRAEAGGDAWEDTAGSPPLEQPG